MKSVPSLALVAILSIGTASPSLADGLSFTDLGPWTASNALQARIAKQLASAQTATITVPRQGTATFSGHTVGTVHETASGLAVGTPTTSDYRFHGSANLSVDFSHNTFASTFANFKTVNVANGARSAGIPGNYGVTTSGTSTNFGPVTSVTFTGSVNGNSLASTRQSGISNVSDFPPTPASASLTGSVNGNKAVGTWSANATARFLPLQGTMAVNGAFVAKAH